MKINLPPFVESASLSPMSPHEYTLELERFHLSLTSYLLAFALGFVLFLAIRLYCLTRRILTVCPRCEGVGMTADYLTCDRCKGRGLL